MDIALLGVPYALDRRLPPQDDTPARFQAAGLAGRLAARSGGAVTWRSIEPPLPEGTPQERIATIMRALAESVAEARAEGRFPLVLGGDCMTALGVVAGLERAERAVGVLWFDAHGDFNTWETTPSGYLGGMPLAMLVGRVEAKLAQGAGVTRPVAETDVILAGARDLDPLEREALEASAITHLPDVEALLAHPLPPLPLYVHLDVDVLDPGQIPAVGYPVPGGPGVETLARVLRHVMKGDGVAALTVASLRAAQDADGRSLEAVVTLLEAAVGALSARRGD